MNFDQYFKDRADLAARVLFEPYVARPVATDWRFFVVGITCVAVAIGLQAWAANVQSDSGYFARTTTFLYFVLLAGAWLLTISLATDHLLERLRSARAKRERKRPFASF